MSQGFNVVYAKSGGRPSNKFFENRREVVIFLMKELNNIDFICVNDVPIDKSLLVKNNIKLSRYLKLKKIYEI
jgi:hypothetical protein